MSSQVLAAMEFSAEDIVVSDPAAILATNIPWIPGKFKVSMTK